MKSWDQLDIQLGQAEFLWVDLPAGKGCRASKLEAADTIIQRATAKSAHHGIPIICMIPWVRESAMPMSFPHNRWKRILASWKPATASVCLCKQLDASKLEALESQHHRFRFFSSNIELNENMCAHIKSEGETGSLSKEAERSFIRSLFFNGTIRFGAGAVISSRRVITVEKQGNDSTCAGTSKRPARDSVKRYRSKKDTIGGMSAAGGDHLVTSTDVGYRATLDRPTCSDDPQELPDSELVGTIAVHSFPTDSKARQNERRRKDKEAGIERVVVKRLKVVEDHHDDCGEDISSLGPLDSLFCQSSSDEEEEDPIVENLTLFCLWGSVTETIDCDRLQCMHFSDWEQSLAALASRGEGIDIAEICGGQALTSRVAIRRRLKTGLNFDLVTDCDLTRPRCKAYAWRYFNENQVFIAVMAPVCGPYGPMSELSWHRFPDTMAEKELAVRPIAEFCGQVALLQLKRGRHFIQEQPHPSKLYEVAPWPIVLGDAFQVIYHRCMCGLKIKSGPHKGLFMKKPSTMTASHNTLVQPFRHLICNHLPEQHLPGIGNAKQLSEAQVWTHIEAERIVDGIVNLRRSMQLKSSAFPAIKRAEDVAPASPGVITPGRDLEACPLADTTCKSCKARWARNHWEHNRVKGDCGYPHDEPFIPTCEKCWAKGIANRDVEGHDLDAGCWWGTRGSRQGGPRAGRHPRDPAVKAAHEPTHRESGAPGGKELGIQGERELDLRDGGMSAAGPGGSSSSASGKRPLYPNPMMEEGSEPLPFRTRQSKQDKRFQDKPIPLKPDGEVVLGEDSKDKNPDDWTQFDVGRVLRTLRLAGENQARLTLRKLHIRWWHASAAAMSRLLNRAGVPERILKLIPPIVQTCASCRAWARPQPENMANVDLPESFNAQVEADLMFVHDAIIFHMIDRCTRWYHSIIIKGKTQEALIEALDTWFRLHGPPKELIMDQETGIQASAETLQFLHRNGVHYEPRAKGQQVPYIDRRGALVREVMHKIISQLKREGIKMPIKQVLSEATFCTNALLSVNGSTPYNAVYGRVPHILPSIDQPDALNESNLDLPGTIRFTHRLREISVAAMIEETAKTRASRALQSRSRPAGERSNYKCGDLVDFYRPGGSKDASGWIGPAKIIDPTHINRGTITIRHIHRPVEVRTGDLRHHLPFFVFLAQIYSAYSGAVGSWHECRAKVDVLASNGKNIVFGNVYSQGKWRTTPATLQHAKDANEFLQFAAKSLRVHNVVAVRIGKGCGSVPHLLNFDDCTMVYWYVGEDHTYNIVFPSRDGDATSIGHVEFRQLDPQNWERIRFIQVFGTSTQVLCEDPVKEEISIPEVSPGGGMSAAPWGPDENLSTIPEDSEEESLFIHDDISLEAATKEACKYCAYFSDDLSTEVGSEDESLTSGGMSAAAGEDEFSEEDVYDLGNIPSNYHLIAANIRDGFDKNKDIDVEENCVEVFYENQMHKIMSLPIDEIVEPKSDEYVVEHVYKSSQHKNKSNKKAVVERADSDLSAEDQRKHWPEVAAAMKKELETWVTLKCISRKPKSQARNVIDVTGSMKRLANPLRVQNSARNDGPFVLASASEASRTLMLRALIAMLEQHRDTHSDWL